MDTEHPKDGLGRAFEATYEQLRRIARGQRLIGPSAELTQASALVHETYLRFRNRLTTLSAETIVEHRAFIRIATLMLRSVAIERWRRRTAARRGGGGVRCGDRIEATASARQGEFGPEVLLALDEALDRLKADSPDGFAVIAQRYLLGRSLDECAHALGIDRNEVRRRRRRAMERLRRELG